MEQIEPGQYKYASKPMFVNYPKDAGHGQRWHVWGSEDKVKIGYPCEVYSYSEQETKTVEILDYVAERSVLKRVGGRVRYVMATFDDVAES